MATDTKTPHETFKALALDAIKVACASAMKDEALRGCPNRSAELAIGDAMALYGHDEYRFAIIRAMKASRYCCAVDASDYADIKRRFAAIGGAA